MTDTTPDAPKAGAAKATLTPADLAQAVAQARPEWLGQPLDARLLGQALREAFGVLRQQVDAVDVGTVAVPSLGRFHARRAPNKPDLRRVLFLTPQWAQPGALEASEPETESAEEAQADAAVLAAEPAAEAASAAPPAPAPQASAAKSSAPNSKRSKRKR